MHIVAVRPPPVLLNAPPSVLFPQEAGFLRRTGLQYHWHNEGFTSFDHYLAALKQALPPIPFI